MRLTRAFLAWREASTVMICARKGQTVSSQTSAKRSLNHRDIDFDYKLLMLERSGKSSFFPSAYVFPGGGISSSDHSESWMPVFGSKLGGLNNFKGIISPGDSKLQSPMFTMQRDWSLPSEVAFRICAIRETFEEAGLLLCKYVQDGKLHSITEVEEDVTRNTALMELLKGSDILNQWRKKIQKDPSQFLLLCEQYSLVPDILSLQEWSNWLTPTNMDEMHGGRRYDTAFYICGLDSQPESLHDNKEIIASNWHEPRELLNDFVAEKHWLAPPQVYELQRLCNFGRLDDLKKFAKERQEKGCERWMPVRNTFSDGIIAALPGDELYPEVPDYEGKLPAAVSPQTMAESTESCRRAHRMELAGPFSCNIRCNIAQPMHHAAPYPLNQILS